MSVSHPSAPDIISRAIERIDDDVFLKFVTESLSKRTRPDMYFILLDLVESEDPWVVKHSMQSLDMIEFDGKKKMYLDFINSADTEEIIEAYAYMGLARLDPLNVEVQNKLIGFANDGTKDTREAAAVGGPNKH